MKQLVLILFFALNASSAFAKPVYLNMLASSIPNAQLNNKCMTCHMSGPQLNPFGRDFAKVKNSLGPDFSMKFWESLKSIDSDGDGLSNQDEIAVGRNPGVAGH